MQASGSASSLRFPLAVLICFMSHLHHNLLPFSPFPPLLIYGVLALLLLVELGMVFGYFFPGDFLLLAAGILAGSYRDLSWMSVALTATAASFLGSEIGFEVGKRFGSVLTRNNNPPNIEKSIERSKRYLNQSRWPTIVFSNFVPGIRSFVPVVAGQSSIKRFGFVGANAIGSVIWVSLLSLIGYELAAIRVIQESPFVIAAGLFLLSSGASIFSFFRAL